MYPECLDGGEDFLLVAGEDHAHSEQVSMETETQYGRRLEPKNTDNPWRGPETEMFIKKVNSINVTKQGVWGKLSLNSFVLTVKINN